MDLTNFCKMFHTKRVKRILFFAAILIFLFFSASSVKAYNYQKVLGASSQNLSISPTVEGPGIFLPDSPFYFLDQFKQAVRLAIALTPEQKAKVRTQIAGERMAELRFMLSKNNDEGIKSTLNDISENLKDAAQEVDSATFAGKDTTKLAKEINDNIKEKQVVLDELNKASNGEIKAWIQSAVLGVTSAKIKVESSLNEADFENEIKDDIDREIDLELYEASQSGTQLQEAFEDYRLVASEAARKSIEARARNIERYEEKVASREAEGKNPVAIAAQKRALERAKEHLERTLESIKNYEKDLNSQEEDLESTAVTGSKGTSNQSKIKTGGNSEKE